ncbi:glycosyltransferase [Aquimarina pacifica]|uniref:glycosyltransferase n=1 Tax=Aquimarina pacifica TaxID=1296415 RepID=UPI00046FDC21|nr:glycosyltransferase [Aquimarina pacifica]
MELQKNQEISVILPVYNGEAFLQECLRSIIDQTIQPKEIIVIDDGSQDQSKQIIEKFKEVTYVFQENAGVAAARNLGIKMAQGNLIAFIDQDDIWTHTSLADRLICFTKNQDHNIVIGKQQWFLDGLDEIPKWVKPEQVNQNLDGYLLGCALIDKRLFSNYGDFDISFRFSSDFDWFFRIKDAGISFFQTDAIVLKKRIHATNESRHAAASLKELSRAIFLSIKRKRKQSKNN